MSKEALSSIEDNFFTCEICVVPYTTGDNSSMKVPKTLGCLHTFCKECLWKAINPGASQIECFVCRIPTVLDVAEGVDSIKTNFMLQNLIAAMHLSSSALLPGTGTGSASASAGAGNPIVTAGFQSVSAFTK